MPAGGGGVDGDRDLGPRLARAALDQRAQRRLEARVVEHVGMEVEDLAAELSQRLGDRRSRAHERRLAAVRR